MQETKNILIKEYDYNLPDERVAKFPLSPRDSSKLLVYKNNTISESVFSHIDQYIPEGATLVFNNTKVIHARLVFYKETGARIEVFCLEPVSPPDYASAFQQTGSVVWQCMVGNLKKWKDKLLTKTLNVNNREIIFTAELIENHGLTHHIRFSWADGLVTFSQILEAFGELPIPPYLHRDTCAQDNDTYQTVYSKIEGSVAAPTAGLHFTQQVFDQLKQRNVNIEELTLHIGAGTFHPVKADRIDGHEMHTEWFLINKSLITKILQQKTPIIAVGTTSVRTLESLYYIGAQLQNNPELSMSELRVTQWMPYEREYKLSLKESLRNIITFLNQHNRDTLEIGTQIIIAPGFTFRVVSGIITNFHQPKSTLLLLVSAFVGKDWKNIYNYALDNNFRFLSYGDSSLLLA